MKFRKAPELPVVVVELDVQVVLEEAEVVLDEVVEDVVLDELDELLVEVVDVELVDDVEVLLVLVVEVVLVVCPWVLEVDELLDEERELAPLRLGRTRKTVAPAAPTMITTTTTASIALMADRRARTLDKASEEYLWKSWWRSGGESTLATIWKILVEG